MRIIPGRIRYIAEAQHVQLGVSATTRGIDGEQNRPCNQACGKASRTHDSQKTQEQIAVDGRVVQNMGVGDFKERPEPVEEARRELGAPFATETLSISSQAQFNKGRTYCVCQHGRCVLGAYHRIWVRRQIKNRPNQNVASTSAGTRVVTNADSDVEPPPPNAEMTSEAAVEALPRASPTLGSLAGFCSCVSAVSDEQTYHGGLRTRGSIRLTTRFSEADSTMVGTGESTHGHPLDRRLTYRVVRSKRELSAFLGNPR